VTGGDRGAKIGNEETAQGILEARAKFPGSLADLYDPRAMPPELLKAHRDNDRAVRKLYGFTARNAPDEAPAAFCAG
jgi:hypothetical protein